MGRLVLVRHGQASFLSDDYDRLSPLGIDQSQALGTYWARHRIEFTHAFTGPCRRHRQTAEHAAEAASATGHALPPLADAPGLNEFDWEALLAHALSDTCADTAFTDLRAAFAAAETVPEKRRAIHFLMETITERWVTGEFNAPGAEPFSEFQRRVHDELARVMDIAGKGGNAVLFTSGGPAGVCAGLALGLPPRKTMELMTTLRNAAIVELLYTPGKLSLSTFNDAPHLEPRQWTYR